MTSELRTEESKVRRAALESNLAAQPSKKNLKQSMIWTKAAIGILVGDSGKPK